MYAIKKEEHLTDWFLLQISGAVKPFTSSLQIKFSDNSGTYLTKPFQNITVPNKATQ